MLRAQRPLGLTLTPSLCLICCGASVRVIVLLVLVAEVQMPRLTGMPIRPFFYPRLVVGAWAVLGRLVPLARLEQLAQHLAVSRLPFRPTAFLFPARTL